MKCDNALPINEIIKSSDMQLVTPASSCLYYSQDGGGTISVQELRTAINLLGGDLSEEQVAVLMTDLDFDRSGEVDLEEFTAFFYALLDSDLRKNKDSESQDDDGSSIGSSYDSEDSGGLNDSFMNAVIEGDRKLSRRNSKVSFELSRTGSKSTMVSKRSRSRSSSRVSNTNTDDASSAGDQQGGQSSTWVGRDRSFTEEDVHASNLDGSRHMMFDEEEAVVVDSDDYDAIDSHLRASAQPTNPRIQVDQHTVKPAVLAASCAGLMLLPI